MSQIAMVRSGIALSRAKPRSEAPAKKLPLARGVACAAGILALCLGVAGATAALAIESPLTPLATKTVRLERTQDLAAILPAPVHSSWTPDLARMLPVTESSSSSCGTVTGHAVAPVAC